MHTLGHQRILASAGSGKTYQLVNRYLTIVDRLGRPDGILASTFTRAAAGEIRGRILLRLAEAADNAKKRKELGDDLGHANLSREDVLNRLALLTRSIHRMNIRTLDSFFASIVRAFALELRVPPGAQVLDEVQAAALRTEAIRRVLDEADAEQLVELLRLITQGRSERGVHRTIDREVNELYGVFRESTAEAWEVIRERPGRLDPPALVEAIQRLEAVRVEGKARGNAHAADCERARAWKWDEFLGKGIAAKIAAGETHFSRQEIPADLHAAYQPVVDHAVAELIHRAREQTLATRDLLARFDRHHDTVKREHNAITFSDLAVILNRARVNPDYEAAYDDLCYRLDAQIEHMLLDEFQDTSVPQWRVLEPLAGELVSDETTGRSFFCVGDVKQSIYGWRSGEPAILEQLPTLLFGAGGESAMHDAPLDKSWRSSPVVIDAVNRVFTSLETNDALQDAPAAASAWAAGFIRHTTEKSELPGRVELHLVDVGGGRKAEREPHRLAYAADFIAELHRRAPSRSIGVITRCNAVVQRLMFALGPTGRNLPIGGRGGGPLTDSPVVNAILDLLQLTEHPDDTAAAFHLANTPLGSVVGLSNHRATARRRALAHEVRDRLLREGFATTIAEWVEQIAPFASAYELRRALQLVELAGPWDEAGEWRATGFIELVEAQSVSDTRPAPVQIMTVHQSKGLEFDLVVLPDLEDELLRQRAPVVFTRDGVTGPVDHVCRWMRADLRALVPEVQSLFEAHLERVVRESLCVLYVAMTRARQGLFMLANAPGTTAAGKVSTAGSKAMSGLLRHALAQGTTEPGLVYEAGSTDWLDAPEEGAAPEAKDSSRARPAVIRAAEAADRLRRAKPPSAHDGARLRDRLKPVNREALARGTAMHVLFEQVEWMEDFTATDAALDAQLQRALPMMTAAWRAERIARFREALDAPAIRTALSRGDRSADRFSVERELPFARRTAEGVQTGAIDRVVVEHAADREAVRSVEILDFKTDRVEPGRSTELAAHYRPQLRAYADAIAGRFGVKAADIGTRLVFVESGEVVEVA